MTDPDLELGQNPGFEAFLRDNCAWTSLRRLPGGLYAGVQEFMFTAAIMVSRENDRFNVANRWCYHTVWDATAALEQWSGFGEPEGWHRHPMSGRRLPADPWVAFEAAD